jgi:hypothetical protein
MLAYFSMNRITAAEIEHQASSAELSAAGLGCANPKGADLRGADPREFRVVTTGLKDER